MKNKIFLSLLVTNFLLLSCTNSVSQNENSTQNVVSDNIQTLSGTKTNSTNIQNNDNVYSNTSGVTVKIIKVDDKCIGCGICVRIDSTHFKMNYNTRKAEAIQVNGHNGPLQKAINHCPVDAISVG